MASFDVCIINGSYRAGGVGDQIAQLAAEYFASEGVRTKTIVLRDIPLAFCTNCRACMLSVQSLGCVIEDDFHVIMKDLEEASAYVFISPTNMGDVTALFKRLLERMAVFGYWPWGARAPKYRNTTMRKRAVLFSSCAAPAFFGKMLYWTFGSLRKCAKLLGARVVGKKMIGSCALTPTYTLTPKQCDEIKHLLKHL
ncbi:flavodoxin family protein [Sulfurospirillum sp. T05]|uniref:Flavodoxin family protein n=1 Tax=Sulfurospirillum tamanense TaxID=2813362 RepID=A0ABS2WTV9_9BACT|nr:flavodoxin family protein [Sulfurospirillum tamanensis]MBN2965076.1 flavodoxin family protein [Sulfurospirillum tamanensis]